MNKFQGIFQKKKGSPTALPRIDPSAAKQVTPTHYTPATVAAVEPHGCCRDSVNVFSMSQSTKKLEQQVAELEKKLAKEKELRMMYIKKLERTQDYLRYCLQVAQENGFLDLVLHNKDHADTVNNATGNTSPQLPTTPLHQHHPPSDLDALIDQAKLNGWFINTDEIEFEEKIGQGSTAQIYKATWHGLDVAVKCIEPEFFESNENGVSFFAQELDTLCRQRHRYVLHLMGACLDPPNYAWVVTEFLSSTLKEWLHGPGNRQKERMIELPPLEERVARALEIAQAMQYLHEQKPKVLHRDLKPSNIFLDDAGHVRVADFGHARFLSDEEMALTGETGKGDGTYVYMAPEVIQCEPYNEKCDVYSFGIILNEIITGNYPYIETDYGPTMIAMEVVEGKLRPRLPDDNDGQLGELIELICLSWDGDASIRPSFATITCNLKKLQNRIL
ncbi:serine/threonine-protein kinase STY46 [Rosa chinensis]|uniref:serine/threonine-protein kinase STY46 n=1 Tax=Rosa chinensis TaxID=74649 RepID=UPI001AD8FC5C|nr:serine/threonine-protein kinase STY46 [Rosa chinensis]